MLPNFRPQISTKFVTNTGKNGYRFSALHAIAVMRYICTVIYSGILKGEVWITHQRRTNRNFSEEK